MEQLTVKKQIKRSLPIAFESLINILMTLVDTLVIATLGVEAVGAIGAMGVILNFMQMSIQTIHVSNNTLVSKAVGEENKEKVSLATGNAVIMATLVSIITIILVYIIQPTFPELFKVDKICITYLTIRLMGFIQSSIVTVLSGHQRAIGNQGNILELRIVAVVLNLLLDIFVVKKGYGVAGVAYVTIAIDTLLAIYLYFKSTKTVKYKLNKNCFMDLFYLFKWNFVERIASKIDNFVFNIIVSRMGELEYAVHVILQQIANIYEAFIQGFGDGITISVGIATGKKEKQEMETVKAVARKVIKYCKLSFPILILIIAIIVRRIALPELELAKIYYKVLPLLLIGTYVTASATYYFAILRGIRDFKFLAKRNIISSIIKIALAFILGYTPLGILGVWLAYLIYGIVQKYMSKQRYEEIEGAKEK